MKRAGLILFFLLEATVFIFSQNLVPNGSFNEYKKCPMGTSDYKNTPPWVVPERQTGTPDYFNVCTDKKGGQDKFYEQYKYLPDSAFYGLIAYYDASEVREYFTAPLTRSLEKNRKYVAGFKVCLSHKFKYAANHLGLYFSEDKLSGKNNTEALTQYTPQIDNPGGQALANDSQWVFIVDSFIAKGNERYVTIGNFFNDKQTKVMTVDGKRTNGWAYYFVDDIFVVPGELYVPKVSTEIVAAVPEEISTCNKETSRLKAEAASQKKTIILSRLPRLFISVALSIKNAG